MEKVSSSFPLKKMVKKLSPTFFRNEQKITAVAQPDVVVFSHLRWEFVTQRPQHLISRIGAGRKVLFVEEPIEFAPDEAGTAHFIRVDENLTVLQPKTDSKTMIAVLRELVAQACEDLVLETPILWFYSPQFVELIPTISHSLVVYDCMDELAAFKGASPQLIKQERKLLAEADVVFTGGKSLYESKRQLHDNVHCFPSSVDRDHFAVALQEETEVPADLASIPQPRVGFYGVIDERLDLSLIEEVAQELPHISFVFIGPVVKISETDLPHAPNIYYLGQKSYRELPKYLKGFDVAMMPFALNEATRFISPTKTLEFMAALKPIVSTPIYDVVRDYKREVKIARDAEEFADLVCSLVYETKMQKKLREQLQRATLLSHSWDQTAQKMSAIMSETLQAQQNMLRAEVSRKHNARQQELELQEYASALSPVTS